MALVLVTDDSLRSFLTDSELQAYETVDVIGTSPDRTNSIIGRICNQVAGHVNASGRYGTLDLNTNKVPQELENATLTLCRHELMAGLPDIESLEGGIRRRQYDAALKVLDLVSRGDYGLADFGGSAPSVLMGSEPKLDWSIS